MTKLALEYYIQRSIQTHLLRRYSAANFYELKTVSK